MRRTSLRRQCRNLCDTAACAGLDDCSGVGWGLGGGVERRGA